ncbi:MAG: YchJ family metal-binding protein [Actinomycetaceae bacterium]|nr:YchJ family metal-binding protein [Actinomycetaceae bacterium]
MCACGSGVSYEDCCGRFHGGEAAPTAEALMRSRYTAFVLRDSEYLLRTWDARTRPPRLDFDPELRWTGLEVLKTVKGGVGDSMGMVHFRAHYETPEGGGVQEERSKFLRPEAGAAWVYVD